MYTDAKKLRGYKLMSALTFIILMINLQSLKAQGTGETGPFSIWNETTVPSVLADPDVSAIEVGVKFRPLVNGYITGIRYYKSEINTGPHVGSLWSSTGVLLARASFMNESSSGWQQQLFDNPVAVTANTTYIASYHTGTGHYSYDGGYFATAISTPYLEAPASSPENPNGVYKFTASSAFPDLPTSNAGNVWVDVVFMTSLGEDNIAPSVISTDPANSSTGVITTSSISASFSEAIDPVTISNTTVELRNSANELIPAGISYNSISNTASLTPSSPLTNSTLYTLTLKGGSSDPGLKDFAGNALSENFTMSFTTADPVQASSQTITFNAPGNKTFGDPPFIVQATSSSGLPVTLNIVSGPASISGNSVTLTGAGEVTIMATQSGNTMYEPANSVSRTFTVFDAITEPGPFSIWSPTTIPTIIADPDASAIELGVKFRPLVNGYITGIRYYKSETNTGSHVGSLWSSEGVILAQATFTNESQSGWQQVIFNTPVAIAAGTTYVASYHTSTGHYSFDSNYFSSAVSTPYLEALAGSPGNPNGVYKPASSSTFPDLPTMNSGNAWVDVLFITSIPTDADPPIITSTTPANTVTGVLPGEIITVKFNEAIDPETININTIELRNASNVLVQAVVTYDAASLTATLTPSANLANSTTYTLTIKGGANDPAVKDLAGNKLQSDVIISFTTADPMSQTITFGELSNKIYGNAPFAVTATASSGLPVSFSISSGPATLSGSTITITGAGDVTVTASQAGDGQFDAAEPVARTFSVGKAEQVISWENPAAIQAGTPLSETQLNATVTGVNGDLTLGALSYNPVIGTILTAGTQVLSVTAAATTNYNAASKTVSLIVTTSNQTITFGELSNKTYGNAPFSISATASSGLPVSFSISSGPATLSGSTITITGAGDVTVTASQGGNDQFDAAEPVARTFSVGKAEQVISWQNPAAIQAGTPLSETQLNATVAGVNGDLNLGALSYDPAIGTMLTTGTQVLSVTAAATTNYNEAIKTVSLIVTTSNQTITFGELSNKTYGNAPFSISATASSGLPVSFSISGPATLSGSTITLTGAGDVTVTASQGGNDQFDAAAPVSRTFTVGKADQVISWQNPAAIQAGTPLSETQLNATVAGVNGDLTLGALSYNPVIGTILNAGTQVLNVTAAATTNYNAASKTVSLIVTTSNQTITFGELSNKTYGSAPFSISATASSGLPVSFSISSGPATLSGSTITLTGAGDVTVTASQGGNDQFDAAAPVSRTFTVGKADQVISWQNPAAIQAGTPLSETQLNATVAGVNGDLTLGALSYNPVIGTILTAGTHVLSVTATATTNYNEAIKTVTINVISPPATLTEIIRINSGGPNIQLGTESWVSDRNFTGGSIYKTTSAISNTSNDALYQTERYGNITYNIPVPQAGRYTIDLHLAELYHSSSGARIFNVNIESGQFQLQNIDLFRDYGGKFAASTIKAQNVQVNDGFITIVFTRVIDYAKISGIAVFLQSENTPVNRPPVVSKPADITLTSGQSWNYQVIASDPDAGAVLTYSATNLPASLNLNASTGLISGNVTATAATYTVNLSVRDQQNLSANTSFVITVNAQANRPPVISKPADVTLTSGQSWNYQVIASDPDEGAILTYSASNLPASLSLNTSTGIISGNLTATAGAYTVNLSVRDQLNLTASTSFVITVNAIANRAPVISKPADITLTPGQSWNYQVIASDPDAGAILTYSATNLPGSLTLNTSTGIISGSISAAAGTYSVGLSVRDQQNLSASTGFIITIAGSGSMTNVVRINSGGPNVQLGTEAWVSDRYFTGGSIYRTTSAISNTSNDVLYQTERYGNITYNIPVPQAGRYTVDLHMAELYQNSSGARIFNVNIESGQFQMQNIDLFRDYGGKFAASVIKAQNVQVNDGFITIVFTRVIDYAKISGIAVFLQPAENSSIVQTTGPNNSVSMTNSRITSENSGKTMLLTKPAVPQEIQLRAYPNPFGKHAMIRFVMPADEQMAILDVFDLKGTRIKRLFEGKATAGQIMELAFDGSNLSAGVYLLRLSTPNKLETFRMIMTD